MGEKIKNIRKERGLTQEGFAEIIGISRFSLINYERGARKVPEEVVRKISEAFNVELKEDFISYSTMKYTPFDFESKINSASDGAPESMRLETFKHFLTLSGYTVEDLTFKELLTLHNKTREYIDFELFKMGRYRFK